jgi:hypothetical protein
VRNFLPRPAANHRGAFLFILFAFFYLYLLSFRLIRI